MHRPVAAVCFGAGQPPPVAARGVATAQGETMGLAPRAMRAATNERRCWAGRETERMTYAWRSRMHGIARILAVVALALESGGCGEDSNASGPTSDSPGLVQLNGSASDGRTVQWASPVFLNGIARVDEVNAWAATTVGAVIAAPQSPTTPAIARSPRRTLYALAPGTFVGLGGADPHPPQTDKAGVR